MSYNEQLMMLIDEQYMRTPFYGVDKMTAWLRRQGHGVNPKRVRRLMRQMALEAVYPRRKRGLSIPDKEHKIYPYLLRDVAITRPDQVWSTDITYIRMCRGWLYLMAIMDWFSRYPRPSRAWADILRFITMKDCIRLWGTVPQLRCMASLLALRSPFGLPACQQP